MGSSDITETTEQRIDPSDDYECPECAGGLVTEGGEVSCGDCGLVVIENRLDYRGKRSFSGGGFTDERTGAPLTPSKHDRGLSTTIGIWGDANGNPLDGRTRRRLGRLRRHHSRARFSSKAERNLAHGFGEINRVRSRLDLPKSVRDRACALYRAAQSENLILGRSIEAMAAGCVYATCRERGWVRTLEEVDEVSSCSASAVRNAYRVLGVELGVTAPPPRPQDFLARFASTIDAPDRMRTYAAELVEAAEVAGVSNGRNPAGVAAACLYLAGQSVGPMQTQSTLSEIAGITPTTIRSRVRELQELNG